MYQIFNPEESLLHLPEEAAIKSISNMVNSYKEFKIAEAKEITNRTICREQSKIAIAKTVEDSNIIRHKSNNRKEATMKLVLTLDNELQNPRHSEETIHKFLDTIRDCIYAI